jgi:hypothetical protein
LREISQHLSGLESSAKQLAEMLIRSVENEANKNSSVTVA